MSTETHAAINFGTNTIEVFPGPWEWKDEPMPGNPDACWGCHESGEGDCAYLDQGACSRCRGYGVEPELFRHDNELGVPGTHWHWGYGDEPGECCEVGPRMDHCPPTTPAGRMPAVTRTRT